MTRCPASVLFPDLTYLTPRKWRSAATIFCKGDSLHLHNFVRPRLLGQKLQLLFEESPCWNFCLRERASVCVLIRPCCRLRARPRKDNSKVLLSGLRASYVQVNMDIDHSKRAAGKLLEDFRSAYTAVNSIFAACGLQTEALRRALASDARTLILLGEKGVGTPFHVDRAHAWNVAFAAAHCHQQVSNLLPPRSSDDGLRVTCRVRYCRGAFEGPRLLF